MVQTLTQGTYLPRITSFCGCFFLLAALSAQPNFTANDKVIPYDGAFRPGYNGGYHPGWNDQTLADLAAGNPANNLAGVGTKSARQGLYFELLRTWGYGVRLAEVQHYQALGMGELTGLIWGGANGGSEPNPPNDVRDLTEYCPGKPSELFKNLYLPIWDNGANGTPYHDDNHFAAYLWQTVNTYKDYVRFWEIWNEPGFDLTGDTGWRPAGDPNGNWWDANPDPCDYKLKAPIFHYVRMLRIAWEVVKTLDPDSYVCLSSPGYQSFLDAVLRNTDNPLDGSLANNYPHFGGAYFDCIAYHSYPHFDGSTVLDPTPPGKYMRNSDRCAEGVVDKRNYFQIVLKQRGYDGLTFPKKEFIVSEINLPRKSFGHPAYFGSPLAQRNFVMKAFAFSKIEKIHQLHFYTLAENKREQDAGYEFDLMGLYKNLANVPPAGVQLNEEGIALKTASDLLYLTDYDPVMTATLPAPANIQVLAFKRPDGKHAFMLWAKATTDLSETASATYSFPTGTWTTGQKFEWNWSQTGQAPTVAPTGISLTATPIFIVADATVRSSEPAEIQSFSIAPNPTSGDFSINFKMLETAPVNVELTDALGRKVADVFDGTLEQGEQAVFFKSEKRLVAGVYSVVLRMKNGVVSRRVQVF